MHKGAFPKNILLFAIQKRRTAQTVRLLILCKLCDNFNFAKNVLGKGLNSYTASCRSGCDVCAVNFVERGEISHVRKETGGLDDGIKGCAGFCKNSVQILHHLFRGSGLKGLSGIAPVRGRMIRPLLWTGREEILCYLKEKHLQWVEDSTNRENEYTRNRIRNELIPLITAEINPQAVQNILRAGERIGQADRYFEAQAEAWLSEYGCYGGDGEETPREYRLDSAALEVQEDILKGYIIRRALTKLSCPLKDITARHLEDVVSLAGKKTGKQVMLPRGIRAEKEYGILRIQAETAPARPEGERTEEDPLFPLKTRIFPCGNPGQFPKNQYTKWFDYDKIKGTMSVRTRRTGDYITLSGGGTKTVKSYMIDEKIPREARDRILLLAEGSHILWIVGHRISEYYKVTEHTKTVLEVQFDGGNGNGR